MTRLTLLPVVGFAVDTTGFEPFQNEGNLITDSVSPLDGVVLSVSCPPKSPFDIRIGPLALALAPVRPAPVGPSASFVKSTNALPSRLPPAKSGFISRVP